MTDFSAHEDELFMQLLKRRAYMIAFPGEMIPVADDIVLRPQYDDNGCCGHDVVKLFVGKYIEGGITGKTLDHWDIAEFIRGFFGVADA